MHEGLNIGHAMADVAANNAGDEWKEVAFDAFKQYARRHSTFTTEQVRLASPDVRPPPDARAWGQVALRAKREGIVVGAGWVRAESPRVHGMVVTQWQSKSFAHLPKTVMYCPADLEAIGLTHLDVLKMIREHT